MILQRLTLYQTTNFKTGPNSKHSQMTYYNCKLETEILFEMGRNIVGKGQNTLFQHFLLFLENMGKGENGGYQHSLLFPQCFLNRFLFQGC